MSEIKGLNEPVTMTFYESHEPDPGPRRSVRTYPTQLEWDGATYDVQATEFSDGSMRVSRRPDVTL